jgi:hypothetical protein
MACLMSSSAVCRLAWATFNCPCRSRLRGGRCFWATNTALCCAAAARIPRCCSEETSQPADAFPLCFVSSICCSRTLDLPVEGGEVGRLAGGGLRDLGIDLGELGIASLLNRLPQTNGLGVLVIRDAPRLCGRPGCRGQRRPASRSTVLPLGVQLADAVPGGPCRPRRSLRPVPGVLGGNRSHSGRGQGLRDGGRAELKRLTWGEP